jgi:predicted nucleic acid-binding protein
MKLLLDANILTRLCHPHKDVNTNVNEWLEKLLGSSPFAVIVPEIADYEVRRGLMHVALKSGQPTTRSLLRLDLLTEKLEYLPLNTATMCRAAGLWAESRVVGQPTAVDDALDGDVILAAQALEVSGVVVTENIRHLSRYVESRHWQDVKADETSTSAPR